MELGGDIGVTSELGKGSRFTVRLPSAASVGRASTAVLPQRPKSLRRARILCVDDEAATLARVEAGQRFDLILCDLMMPAMSGMDLHRELVRVAPDVAARVVFLTGGAITQRARDFLEGVSNPRLEKPIGIDALRNAIAEMVQRG